MSSLILCPISFNPLIFILRQIYRVDINKIARPEPSRSGSFKPWSSDEQPEGIHENHDWDLNIVRDEVDRIVFRVERGPSLDCKTIQQSDNSKDFYDQGRLAQDQAKNGYDLRQCFRNQS